MLDVVFEIYKPEGTGIINDRKSTWLHPIVDGEDAMKMLGRFFTKVLEYFYSAFHCFFIKCGKYTFFRFDENFKSSKYHSKQ